MREVFGSGPGPGPRPGPGFSWSAIGPRAVLLLLGCSTPEIHEPERPASVVALDPDKGAALFRLSGTSVGGGAPRAIEALAEPGGRTAINFWATDCPPCLLELPLLAALDREGKAIAGVSLDGPGADVAGALSARGVKYENLVLDLPTLKEAGRLIDWGVPFTVVLGPDRSVLEAFAGPMKRAQLESALVGPR